MALPIRVITCVVPPPLEFGGGRGLLSKRNVAAQLCRDSASESAGTVLIGLLHSFEIQLGVKLSEVLYVPGVPNFCAIHLGEAIRSGPSDLCYYEWPFP